MLNAWVVVAALLAQGPVEAVEAEAAPAKWEIFVGLTGGLRPDAPAGGGIGLLGINRRVASWLRPELWVGLGAYAGPLDAVVAIKIGARIEWPSEGRIRPYLFLAFAHLHELGWEDAKADPVTGLLGLSSHGEHGVDHRSGLDSGLGVSIDFPPRKDSRFGGRFNLRASLTSLLGSGPPRYAELMASFGLTF